MSEPMRTGTSQEVATRIYKSTTDHAAELRAYLKREHGWTSRQVSVRGKYFSLGSSIEIEIKDPAVSFAVVKRAASEHERIHRCEVTGEILGGGNRYVSVRHSSTCQEIMGRRWVAALGAALAKLPAEGSSTLEPIEGTDYLVGRENVHTARLWGQCAEIQFYPGNEAAILGGAYHLAFLIDRDRHAELVS